MPFNTQPTLRDELIELRPLRADDLEPLYAIANDPKLWALHAKSDRYQRPVFEAFFADNLASGGALAIVDRATGQLVGGSRYQPVAGADDAIEIGWTFIARSHWGGAYNGAVKQLMLAHVFQAVDYVLFYVAGDNHRSHRAVQKIGGKKIIGPALRHLVKPDPSYTSYVISRVDWEGPNRAQLQP